MVLKATLLFTHTSALGSPTALSHRTGGWSETWYWPSNTFSDLLTAVQGPRGVFAARPMAEARASLLPTGASIVGLRMQLVPGGQTQSLPLAYPGSSGILADIPQMGLLANVGGVGVGNRRRFVLRGLPDARVIEGEYSGSDTFDSALFMFGRSLTGFAFRARDLSQTTYQIINIAADGTVTTEAPHSFVLNDMVRILRTLDSGKTARGGRFQVGLVATATSFKLNNWTLGACTLGKARKDLIVFPLVDASTFAAGRVVTRRVGRPSGQYRGRRSRRR